MLRRRLPALVLLLSAVLGGADALAQSRNADMAVLPVVNRNSGKVEGVFVLEPTGKSLEGAR